VCGYDGTDRVLASDMDQRAAGLKKGFYYPVTLEQLSKARSSTYKPFPPQNTALEFDFSRYHQPQAEDIVSAIRQTIESQLNPPIKNIGVKGIRHTAKELLKWPDMFKDYDLRMNLFSLYIYIEIGGSGGGCFRYMYSRFLKESAMITKNDKLLESAEKFRRSGEMFSEIGLLFKESETVADVAARIKEASVQFHNIAELEEDIYNDLSRNIK
jgi:hypothetical protein